MPHSELIQALLSRRSPSKTEVEAAAAQLAAQVTTAPCLETAFWELWVAFIDVVPTNSWQICFELLDAIREQPPTAPLGPKTASAREYLIEGRLIWSELPGFGLSWREEHDSLHHQRSFDLTGATRYLNFVKFSAAWLGLTHGNVGVDAILVFLLSRDVLESDLPEESITSNQQVGCLSEEQLWALDVQLAAIWIRDGGHALWDLGCNSEEMQQYWGRAMATETDLWPRSNGLTRERWCLWLPRLNTFSVDDRLDGETKRIVVQAVRVVEDLLEGNEERER